MPSAPYEETFRTEGNLCFYAAAPALAHFGRRFEELSDGSFYYSAPEEEHDVWRSLTGRLAELVELYRRGEAKPWSQTEKALSQAFPEAFSRAKARMPGPIQEYFRTGQMSPAEYVEWMLLGAEQAWSLNGGADHGLNFDAMHARLTRLGEQLQVSGYETAMDRQLREEDPARYEFMSKSLELLASSMNDPDPAAHERMIEQQMELFRHSPLFQQAQESMLQAIAPLRETDPELYARQMQELEEFQMFYQNPAASLAELNALAEAGGVDVADEQTGDEEFAGDRADEQGPKTPAGSAQGRLLFDCGPRKAITPEQIEAFRQFSQGQEQLRPEIEAALRQMHGWMHPGEPFSWPGDRLLFPDDADQSDVPLQCFRINRVCLESDGAVFLQLDTLFGHFDEHGCFIRIRGNQVERYGTWDEVFDDEGFDELDD